MEISSTESYQMSQETRKRQMSGTDLKQQQGQGAPTMSTAGTQTEQTKRAKPSVANNGWGELFKDRQTFIDMHLH